MQAEKMRNKKWKILAISLYINFIHYRWGVKVQDFYILDAVMHNGNKY